MVHGKDVSNLQGRSEEQEKRRKSVYIVKQRLIDAYTKNVERETAALVVATITGSRMVTLITESI